MRRGRRPPRKTRRCAASAGWCTWTQRDGKPGKTIFRATHRNIHATIFWHLDGEYLGETTEIHDMEARPGPGAHVLTLVDDRGEEYVRTFTCLSEK
jgi:penicillin-binding protein 1C